MTEEDKAMRDVEAHGMGVMMGDKHIPRDAFRDYGRVPDREAFWLIERKVTPPQYVCGEGVNLSPDPWRARRFQTERAAHNHWLTLPDWIRDESSAIEHMFINKPTV